MGIDSEKQDTVDGGIVVEDRLKGRELTGVRTSFIKPSSATPPEKEWLALSNLDYLWTSFYTPVICTYSLKHTFAVGVTNPVQHLKDSLAEALVVFYPLAGEVVTIEGVVKIHCNDAGAAFTEAHVDAELVELKTDDFQPVPMLSGMAGAGMESYPTLPKTSAGRPALVIQVTHFKCGGITLAANWAHAAADGQSGFHFMKSWSELARGKEVSLLPIHDRQLVKTRDPPQCNNPFIMPDSKIANVASRSELAQIRSGALPEGKSGDSDTETSPKLQTEPPKLTVKSIEFTKDHIDRLQTVALAHDKSVRLSRADCLSAHLWRTIVKARGLSGDAEVRFWILVEGRRKLSLPQGYFGNVIGLTGAKATVNELLNNPFSFAAGEIHNAIPRVTTEWFRDLVDWIELKGPALAMEPLGPGREIGGSYLNRFPFYELDFGFGVPDCSIRNTQGAWDGLVFVVPSALGPYNMIAMANLPPDLITQFKTLAYEFPEA